MGKNWKGLENENLCEIGHGIRSEHQYQFRVSAVNEIGQSDWAESGVEKAEDRFS